jgi:hypothetical protein
MTSVSFQFCRAFHDYFSFFFARILYNVRLWPPHYTISALKPLNSSAKSFSELVALTTIIGRKKGLSLCGVRSEESPALLFTML